MLRKEIEKTREKLKPLQERSVKLEKREEEIDLVEREIMKIYEILFKNLSSKRIETDVKIDGEIDERYFEVKDKRLNRVVLNREGFSWLGYSRTNALSLSNRQFSLLWLICKEVDKILPCIRIKNKKKMVKKFAEIITKNSLILNVEQKLKDNDGFLRYKASGDFYIQFDDRNRQYNLFFRDRGIEELALVEELSSGINKIFNKIEKLQNKLLAEREKCLEQLQQEFLRYLILNGLNDE